MYRSIFDTRLVLFSSHIIGEDKPAGPAVQSAEPGEKNLQTYTSYGFISTPPSAETKVSGARFQPDVIERVLKLILQEAAHSVNANLALTVCL